MPQQATINLKKSQVFWESQFFYWLFTSTALVLVVHLCGSLIPLWQNVRLLLVFAFFFGAFSFVWSFSKPLADLLSARDAIRYRHAPETIINSTTTFRVELTRFIDSLCLLFLGLLAVTFFRVVAVWPIFSFLAPFQGTLKILWWLIPLSILFFLIVNTSRIRMLVSLLSVIHRQIETIQFVPSQPEAARHEEERFAQPAVLVKSAEQFNFCGMDLSFNPELRSNLIAFGQIGSGKTVTVLNSLLEGVLTSTASAVSNLPASALILDPKGDFRKKINDLCTRTGRERDLMIFDPKDFDPGVESSVHWNPFDCPETNALELAGNFGSVLKLLGAKNEKDSFFIDSAQNFIRHGITLLRASSLDSTPPSIVGLYDLARERNAIDARLLLLTLAAAMRTVGGDAQVPITVSEILDVLVDSGKLFELSEKVANSPGIVDDICAYFKCFNEGSKRGVDRDGARRELVNILTQFDPRTVVPNTFGPVPHDTQEYYLKIWWTMADNTRNSVRAQLSTMLDPFMQEPYNYLLSGHSTVSLDAVLDGGKIFYVHMPEADGPQMAKTFNTLIKLAFFREVRKRLDKKRPSLFLCDEFQKIFTSAGGEGDTGFFEVSRQSHHINIIATQSVAAMKRDVDNKETVDSLLACCGTKIFLRNTDPETNEYAEKICGSRRELVVNIGNATGQGGGKSGAQLNYSLSESYENRPKISKDTFLTLVVPDKTAGYNYSEAVVFRGAITPPREERVRLKVNPL